MFTDFNRIKFMKYAVILYRNNEEILQLSTIEWNDSSVDITVDDNCTYYILHIEINYKK